MSTIAGSGTRGVPGDGRPPTTASLNWPSKIVLDSAGNICFTDNQNNRIRCINTQITTQTLYGVNIAPGTIQTVAGTGTNGCTGDGGAATSAELAHPAGLAIDASGNLYTADQQCGVIRKVTISGIISSVAGGGLGGKQSLGCGNRLNAGFSGDGGPETSQAL